MALPLTDTDRFLLLSAVGAPETRDRIAALLDLAGTGNMTGPASATDNALVRFDGTTGALVQNSGVLLNDSDGMTVPGASIFSGTTDASSSTTGNVINFGGGAIAKKLFVGTGLAVGGALNIGGSGGTYLSVLQPATAGGNVSALELGSTTARSAGNTLASIYFWNSSSNLIGSLVSEVGSNGSNYGVMYLKTANAGSLTTAITIAQDQKVTVTGQLIAGGTTTNDSAAAGFIGEVLTISNTTDNSLTNGNVFSLGSVSLTAGDWDVWGIASYSGTGSTSTFTIAGIGTSNSSLGTNGDGTRAIINQNLDSQDSNFCVGPFPLKLASPTTYFFNIRADFSAGTVTGKGTLYARRRR